MPDDDTVAEEIIGILRQYVGRRRRITMETTLFVDLGLFGDDAWEILDEFSRRFHVDMSQFRFESHFLYEGHSCLETIIMPLAFWRRYCVRGRRNQGLIPINLQQLVATARCGRWPSE